MTSRLPPDPATPEGDDMNGLSYETWCAGMNFPDSESRRMWESVDEPTKRRLYDQGMESLSRPSQPDDMEALRQLYVELREPVGPVNEEQPQ